MAELKTKPSDEGVACADGSIEVLHEMAARAARPVPSSAIPSSPA